MSQAHDKQQVPGAHSSHGSWGPGQTSFGQVGAQGMPADRGQTEQGQHVPFYKHNHRKDESLFPFIFNPVEKV